MKNIKINTDNIKLGSFSYKDYISGSYINNKNPRYLEINNIYYSSLIIVNYYREYNDLILKNLLELNINMNISIFYEKQDTYKTIKELTYHIGNVGVDLKEKNNNREDIEIAAFTYNDAKYIRKEIQLNNEELYYIYIYITVFSDNIKELEYFLNKVSGITSALGLQTRRANFRQEQTYLATLPLYINKNEIKNAAKRNVLTSAIVSTYPFISSTICDENGVYVGKNIYNNSKIFINRYNTEKYKNANMCIFGTSGAGKSFYTKLLIMRCRLYGIEQYIIDPEREYLNIAKALDGVIIKLGASSDTYVNIFDIRENSVEENKGYLSSKLSKLIGFFNLVFGEMNEEEKSIIEEKLIELYKLKNITFDDNTLYKIDKEKINIKPVFKDSKDMPILEDFYNLLSKDEKLKKFKIKLLPFVKGSLKFFNNYTNIKTKNKLIIADVYELGEENLKYAMFLFTELFWDNIKENRSVKKAIYLDEIWRLIGVTSNKEVAGFIYKIFKTIRKYGGSAVAITQDISDLFSLDNGNYGRSILNNTSIKSFFALEEENILLLSKYMNLSEKEKVEVKSLKRGESLMIVGEEHILVNIDAAEYEKNIIEKGELINE